MLGEKRKNKIKFVLIATFILSVVFLFSSAVLAQTSAGLTSEFATTTGLGTTDIRITIANIIRIMMGFLGVVALIIVLYGGFVYQTASGNPDRVSLAKKILLGGAIGLVITLSSFAITQYILNRLTEATGTTGGLIGEGGGTGGTGGGGGAAIFKINTISPEGNIAIRNIVVRLVFNSNVDARTITDNITVRKTSDQSLVAGKLTTNGQVVEFLPDAGCPAPNNTRKCFDANTEFRVSVDSTVKSLDGKFLTCGSFGAICGAIFTAGNLVDTSAPLITITSPLNNASVAAESFVPVTAKTTDDAGISYVEYYLDDRLIGVDSPVAGQTPVAYDSLFNWNTAGITPGSSHALRAKAFDIDSNTKDSNTVTVLARAAHCFNKIQDTSLTPATINETGVDCGGGECSACSGSSCQANSDCSSGYCDQTTKICVEQPVIVWVDPNNGAVGNFVTIVGSGFGEYKDLEKEIVTDPSLVGWWNFEEGSGSAVKDKAGKGNNGSINLGSSGNIDLVNARSLGKFGQGLRLDGVDDYVLVPDSASLQVTKKFTFSAWVYKTGGAQGLISKDGVGADKSWGYNFYVNDNFIRYETNNINPGASAPGRFTLNAWHQVALTFDDSATPKMKFFIDGIKTGEGNPTAPAAIPGWPILLGRRGAGDFFKGMIDEIKIYNRTLSDDEIKKQSWKNGVIFLGNPSDPSDDQLGGVISSGCGGINQWQDKQIVVEIPSGAKNGPLEILNAKGLSDTTNNTIGPQLGDFQINNTIRPGLCALDPQIGQFDTKVNLLGKNFGVTKGNVLFGLEPALGIGAWANAQISAAAVPNLKPGVVRVQAKVGAEYSNALDFTVKAAPNMPRIDYLNPVAGPVGQYITIYGSNFGASGRVVFTDDAGKASDANVDFPAACSASFWRDTSIVIKAPSLKLGGAMVKVIRKDGLESNSQGFSINNTSLRPGICRIDPDNGREQTPVTVYGERFGSQKNKVTFWDETQSSTPDTWSDKEIKTRVSLGAKTGPARAVDIGGTLSNDYNFRVGQCPKDFACVAGENCCAGSCQTKACQVAGANISHYSWPFKTGAAIFGTLPRVVERDCASSRSGQVAMSPNPYKGTIENCSEAGIMAKFNTAMNASTFNSNNIIITKCTGENIGCKEIVAGTIAPLPNSDTDGGFSFQPASSFDQNIWYRVTLRSEPNGIQSERGLYLDGDNDGEEGGDYTWSFRIKAIAGACSIDYVSVEPENEVKLRHIAETQKYNSLPFASNCNLLNANNYDWAWSSLLPGGASGAGIATVSQDKAGEKVSSRQTATAGNNSGQTLVTAEALATGGKKDNSPLTVNLSLPYIDSLTPDNGIAESYATTYITISGNNFGTEQGGSKVLIGGRAAEIACAQWSATQIVAIMPAGIAGEIPAACKNNPKDSSCPKFSVEVITAGGESNLKDFTVNNIIRPNICKIVPNFGKAGDATEIQGSNFGDNYKHGANPALNSYFEFFNAGWSNKRGDQASVLGGLDKKDITSWANSSIKNKVPDKTQIGNVRVSVLGNGSNTVAFTARPFVIRLSPDKGRAGTWVTISGGNFGATRGKVYFYQAGGASATQGDVTATNLIEATLAPCNGAWSDTQIIAVVPEGAEPGLVRVETNMASPYVSLITKDEDSKKFEVNTDPLGPGICELAPSRGIAGDRIVANGDRFDDNPKNGKIVFASEKVLIAPASGWSNKQISAIVPVGTITGPARVEKTLTIITGRNCTGIAFLGICFGGSWQDITEERDVRSNEVQFTIVPPGSCTSNSDCTACGAGKSQCVNGQCTPVITNFTPQSGATSTWVTIDGCYFGCTKGKVYFTDNKEALWPNAAVCGNTWQCLSNGRSQIVAEVPNKTNPSLNAVTGPIRVTRDDGVSADTSGLIPQANFVVNGDAQRVKICNIRPASSEVDKTVKVLGEGFGTARTSADNVNFEDKIVATFVDKAIDSSCPANGWSENAICAKVPGGWGTIPPAGISAAVRVVKGVDASNPRQFTILPTTLGGSCNKNTDCTGGQVCVAGTCTNPCTKNTDCTGGQFCVAGVCTGTGKVLCGNNQVDSVEQCDKVNGQMSYISGATALCVEACGADFKPNSCSSSCAVDGCVDPQGRVCHFVCHNYNENFSPAATPPSGIRECWVDLNNDGEEQEDEYGTPITDPTTKKIKCVVGGATSEFSGIEQCDDKSYVCPRQGAGPATKAKCLAPVEDKCSRDLNENGTIETNEIFPTTNPICIPNICWIDQNSNNNIDLTDNALVGHWKMDEGGGLPETGVIVDSSGKGNNGRLAIYGPEGTAPKPYPTWVRGKFGKALKLNGNNNFVDLPRSATFYDNWQNGITIELWVKSNTATWNAPRTFVDKYPSFNFGPTNAGTKSISFYVYRQQSYYGGPNGTGAYGVVAYTSKKNVQEWHHYAATFDNQNIKIYEDGVLMGTTAFAGPIRVQNLGVSLGVWAYEGAKYVLNGAMDEVKIYNTALSVDQIQQDYLTTASSKEIFFDSQSVSCQETGAVLFPDAPTSIPGRLGCQVDISSCAGDNNPDLTGLNPPRVENCLPTAAADKKSCVTGATNVCLNAAVEVDFSQAMKADLLTSDNIILEKCTAQESGCQKVGQNHSVAIKNEKIVILDPGLLDPGTWYRVTVKGGDQGVKSKVDNLNLAGANSGSDFAWSFQTSQVNKDTTYCQVAKVDVTITPSGEPVREDFYLCAGRNDCPGDQPVDDPATTDKDEHSLSPVGNQHKYFAQAYDNTGVVLQANYTWSHDAKNDPSGAIDLIGICSETGGACKTTTDCPTNPVQTCRVPYSSNELLSSQEIYVTGNPKQGAEATLPVMAVGDCGPVSCGSANEAVKVTIFMCANPWPAISGGAFTPYQDSTICANSSSCLNSNFETYYCRDAGDATKIEDDLPAMRAVSLAGPANVNLLKETLFTRASGLTTDNNDGSPDVIGVRVEKNPDHLPPLKWYTANVPRPAAPAIISMDGYTAVRDGRTIYTNAANWTGHCSDNGSLCSESNNCSTGASCNLTKSFYTNIYLISYNNGAGKNTQDIYTQMMNNWRFNYNLDLAKKEELVRDTRRLEDLNTIRDLLDAYKAKFGTYPVLDSGTYIKGYSTSIWPSWQAALGSALGAKLPTDPVNKLKFIDAGACGTPAVNVCADNSNLCCATDQQCVNGEQPKCAPCPAPYDPNTCWSETLKKFYFAL